MSKAAGTAITDLFDRVYVINLPHRADRRAEMARQLGRIGLDFDHPRVTLWPARPFSDAGGFPSPAVRGCFDSHLRVLEDIAAAGLHRALVLEDDADFSRDAPDRWPALCDAIGAREWGLFYGWPPRDAPPAQGEGMLVDLPADTATLLAHCYGVTGPVAHAASVYLRAMARRPVGDPLGGPMHFDGALNWFRRAHPEIVTRAARTPIAVQRSSRSDIHASAWYDRIRLLAPVLSALRRIKGALRG